MQLEDMSSEDDEEMEPMHCHLSHQDSSQSALRVLSPGQYLQPHDQFGRRCISQRGIMNGGHVDTRQAVFRQEDQVRRQPPLRSQFCGVDQQLQPPPPQYLMNSHQGFLQYPQQQQQQQQRQVLENQRLIQQRQIAPTNRLIQNGQNEQRRPTYCQYAPQQHQKCAAYHHQNSAVNHHNEMEQNPHAFYHTNYPRIDPHSMSLDSDSSLSQQVARLQQPVNCRATSGGGMMQGYTRQQNLTTHICEWFLNNDKENNAICGMQFTCLSQFVAHIRESHVGGHDNTDHSCYWRGCSRNKPFQAKYKLVNHIRVHTGERPFTCTVCSRSFARKENKKIHDRTHTREKPFQCRYQGCVKKFGNSSDRKKHSYTHSTTKKYECPICKKRYTHPSSLQKHMKSAHSSKNVDASQESDGEGTSGIATSRNGILRRPVNASGSTQRRSPLEDGIAAQNEELRQQTSMAFQNNTHRPGAMQPINGIPMNGIDYHVSEVTATHEDSLHINGNGSYRELTMNSPANEIQTFLHDYGQPIPHYSRGISSSNTAQARFVQQCQPSTSGLHMQPSPDESFSDDKETIGNNGLGSSHHFNNNDGKNNKFT